MNTTFPTIELSVIYSVLLKARVVILVIFPYCMTLYEKAARYA